VDIQSERDEYVRLMGPELGQVCHELENDFAELVQVWTEHKELFRTGGQDRFDLLNTVASSFFYFLNNMFHENAALHLCRLTDPPRSCGHDTLTVMRLAPLVIDTTLKAVVESKADIAKQSCDFARPLRHKRLAHTDLETLRFGLALVAQDVTIYNIDEAMAAVRDVLSTIQEHYGLHHSISIPNPWGSKALVGYLRHSEKVREQERAVWQQFAKQEKG